MMQKHFAKKFFQFYAHRYLPGTTKENISDVFSTSYFGLRQEITALRGVAIIQVLGFHFFPKLVPNGFLGVDLFFVLSGYVISLTIIRQIVQNDFTIRWFWRRRIRRLLPNFLALCFATYAIAAMVLSIDEFSLFIQSLISALFSLSNFYFLFENTNYWSAEVLANPLGHTWSLAVEEQFYLLWPIFILVFMKFRFRKLLQATSLVVILSFLCFLYMSAISNHLAFYAPVSRFYEIGLGCLVYFIREGRDYSLGGTFLKSPQISWLALSGVVAIPLLPYTLPIPVLLPFFVVLVALCLHSRHNFKGLCNSILSTFGKYSYSLYLWHWFILTFSFIFFGRALGYSLLLFQLALSFLIAFLAFRFLEEPFRLGRIKLASLVLPFSLLLVLSSISLITPSLPSKFHINLIDNLNVMQRDPMKDSLCLSMISFSSDLDYCRYKDSNSKETIAIIGDSHASIVFSGLSRIRHYPQDNYLLLAGSNCPSLLYLSVGRFSSSKKCVLNTQRILEYLMAYSNIKKILIVSRGAYYVTGKDYPSGPISVDSIIGGSAGINQGAEILNFRLFESALKQTVLKLNMNGKDVFLLQENPEMSFSPSRCLLKTKFLKSSCPEPESTFLIAWHMDHDSLLTSIKNTTYIKVFDLFCDKKCNYMRNGISLYSDNDHLSTLGSTIQAQRILQYIY